MKRVCSLLLVLTLFVFGCAAREIKPQKTQLQIREFQTRTFDTSDSKMVMKAMLNVLQDDGFIVKNAATELGLITAQKEVDVENTGEKFWAIFWMGIFGTWKKSARVECTANVSNFGAQTKVRVNFQMKVLDNRGGIREVRKIEDQKYYQNFFAKVQKGIFIQKEQL